MNDREKKDARIWSRRDALKVCIVPAGAIASRWILGCSSESPNGGFASGGPGGAAPTSTGGSGTGNDAGSAVPWATGGTKSMTGNYPDPFNGGSGAPCVLYPAQTIGPCYAQNPLVRADISDGLPGLPMRLSLLVVRSSGCTPVTNATVDIWHSGSNGIYSAFAAGTICNPTTENVLGKTFCRGILTTDENGRVDFDTIFPGWYTGRTIHIHFTVRLNGGATATSQLYFEDTLSEEILAQGEYQTRGARDTTNATDFLFLSGGATPEQVTLSTAKRLDGALHAWKVLSIA